MCDGGILDKSAALSDLFNQAAKTGLWGSHFDELQLHVRLMNFYRDRVDIYRCKDHTGTETLNTIFDGLMTGGEIDDFMSDIFSDGTPQNVMQAVNFEIDLWAGQSASTVLDNLIGILLTF